MNDSPISTLREDDSAPMLLRYRLLLSVLLLVIAADSLTYGIPPGPGVALFCGLLWAGLRLNRPAGETGWKDLLLFGLMTASAVQIVIEPSFSNGLVLLLLTFYASGHFLHRRLGPFWRRALEGFLAIFDLAETFLNLWRGLCDAKESTQSSSFRRTVAQGRRWGMVVLPAAVAAVLFMVLFGSGNAVMGDGMESAFDAALRWLLAMEMPSLVRVVFWVSIGFGLLALLTRAPLSPLVEWVERRLPEGWPVPTDLTASIWRTRILLVAVNVIFFTANSVDVIYLWLGEGLPEGIVFSEYTHRGVYNLIACLVLAAGFLLVVFQQSREVARAPGQKLLAYVWIGQNLLLVSSVVYRLKSYIDAYYMSLLRLYVVFFLILVVVGFILLAIKLGQERRLSWLVNANLLAVFTLFFAVQFLNDRAYVAEFNYAQATRPKPGFVKLDVNYLNELGPAAWQVLRRVADESDFFGRTSAQAHDFLRGAMYEEQERLERSDWRSWQYRRSVARRALPGFETGMFDRKGVVMAR